MNLLDSGLPPGDETPDSDAAHASEDGSRQFFALPADDLRIAGAGFAEGADSYDDAAVVATQHDWPDDHAVDDQPLSEDQRPTHLPDDLPQPALPGHERERVPTPGGHDSIAPLVVPRTNSRVGYLIVKEPPAQRGNVYPVLPNTTIGRQNTRIVLRDRRVSRTHARIELAWQEQDGEDRFIVHDLGTPNDTWVNGKPISGPTAIRENNVVKIGGFIFVFKTLP